MIGKIVVIILVFAMLGFSANYIYQNIPRDPVDLTLSQTISGQTQIIDYGETPVFSENLRFNHNDISYFIEPTCPLKRKREMINGFNEFQKTMPIISFYETSKEKADIQVGCSDSYIEIGENLFAAGEGGPSRIINSTNFRVIEKGKIVLFKETECDQSIVEIHELGHVLGFDHSSNPKSIMYNVSRCDQRITPDMTETINQLYSIEPLPDARISELIATKKGRYLDFNITVLNDGLTSISNMSLTLESENKEIKQFYLNEINIGSGRTLFVTNLKLDSIKTNTVNFIIDKENSVEELSEDNNMAKMTVSP